MIGYVGVIQAVEADQNYEEPLANAYGGNPRINSRNKQIVGYGGSYQRDVVQTTRTKYSEYYPHTVGIAIAEPTPWSSQAQVREHTNRIKNENKKTGTYERITMKEKMTKGETHVERSSGRYGIANEMKRSAKVKIGDKSGYTEYYTEEKVRRVHFDGNKSTGRMIQGSKNTSLSLKHGSGSGKKSSITVNHGKNKSTNVSISYGKKSSGGKRVAK